MAIDFQICDRSGGDAAIHSRFGNGRRYALDEAGIERRWYQVVRPKLQTLTPVGRRNYVGHLSVCEIGDGENRR